MKKTTGVILAGGKSKRMGFDKQELEINGRRLVGMKAEKMLEFFDQVVVVTNREDLYYGMKVKTIRDIYPGHGPISGLHTVMKNINSDFFYVTACDMPEVSKEFIEFLYSRLKDDSMGAITKKDGRIEPLSAIYSRKLLPRIEDMIEKSIFRIKDLVDLGGFDIIEESELRKIFNLEKVYRNLNTREEYESYLDEISEDKYL